MKSFKAEIIDEKNFPEFTLEQLAYLKRLEDLGQLHLVGEAIRSKYLRELRVYLLLKSGIEFKITGAN